MKIPPPPPEPRIKGTQFWGTVLSVESPSRIKVELRTRKTLELDLREAQKAGKVGPIVVGGNVALIGKLKDDMLEAESMRRAKGKQTWGEDRRE